MTKTPGSLKMTDVAAAAGVSVMTVSRALQSGTKVAPATRAKVLRVVQELGYIPDLLAGSLSSKRSGFVALLVPSLNNPHFAETVMGMKRVLEPEGMQVLLGFTNYQASEEQRLVQWMLQRKPEAIVLTYDGHTAQTKALLKSAGIPVIEIWETPARPIEHVVGFSNRLAAIKMTEALIAKGFERIGYIGESSDEQTRGDARRAGFVHAMTKAGLEAHRLIAFGPPPISMEQGYSALAALMNRWPDTQAVMCVSDPCAFGALSYCLSKGWKVPGKLAIAGFGAFEISACSVPPISTLAVSGSEIGETTARLILKLRAEGSKSAQKIAIPFSPLMRESTQPPKGLRL